MNEGLTPSEKFVTNLSEKSFLKLWTHPNPKGKKKDKELCDCLVVCGNHIVIISVKEIEYKDTGNEVGIERWKKSAIDKSVAQIYGAERILKQVEKVERNDGRLICLPPHSDRKYHRISVSFGSKGKVPIAWGDFEQGFIHICDEQSTVALFEALDTITDFINFLNAVEELTTNGTALLFDGGGYEDLVALYLQNGYSFNIEKGSEKKPNLLILSNDLFQGFIRSETYNDMQEDFKNSYIWDRLVNYYSDDLLTDGMFDMHSKEVTNNELVLVTMALQPRNYRANLAEAFIEFLQNEKLKISSRVVLGYNNIAFVFLIGSSVDREHRSRELGLRCLVIRGKVANVTTVIGIATDRPGTSQIGYSSDLLYMHIPELTKEDNQRIDEIQNELGYFKSLK